LVSIAVHLCLSFSKKELQGNSGIVIHIIPALRRLSLEDLKFEVSLGYTVRFCLKNKKQINNNNKITRHKTKKKRQYRLKRLNKHQY
jgi:hypothetical protein